MDNAWSESFSSTALGDATAQTYLATRAHFSFYLNFLTFAEAVSNKRTLKTEHKDFFLQRLADAGRGLGDGLRQNRGGCHRRLWGGD